MGEFEKIGELVIEIIVLLVFIKVMFQLGALTGIFYLVAIVGAAYDGSLFTKPAMGRLLVVGTILTWAASEMFFSGLKSGDILSIAIVFIFAAAIWMKGYLMKKGVIPEEWLEEN